MQKYIDIDIFGRCGKPVVCPGEGTCDLTKDCSRMQADCFKNMAKMYKFYLAFENSICDDYATEKFFKPMSHPIVPVVMGGAKYSEIAPKSAYIDVNDFDSPKSLANHLKYLDRHWVEYMAHFDWRTTHEKFVR
jgi:hypothetical protein